MKKPLFLLLTIFIVFSCSKNEKTENKFPFKTDSIKNRFYYKTYCFKRQNLKFNIPKGWEAYSMDKDECLDYVLFKDFINEGAKGNDSLNSKFAVIVHHDGYDTEKLFNYNYQGLQNDSNCTKFEKGLININGKEIYWFSNYVKEDNKFKKNICYYLKNEKNRVIELSMCTFLLNKTDSIFQNMFEVVKSIK